MNLGAEARRGMTLIELLFAFAIAVLLIGLVFSVYRAVFATIRTQSERRVFRTPAGAAFELLCRDLSRSFAPSGLTNAPFILEPGTNGTSGTRLWLVSAEPTGAGLVYDAVLIQYILEETAGKGGYALVRQRRCLDADPDDPQTVERETLALNVDRFEVEIFDGAEWLDVWGAEPDDGMPLAARVTIAAGKKHGRLPAGRRRAGISLESEILIPAGHVISGRNR